MTHSLWELSRNKLALHKLTYGVAPMRKLIKYTNQGFTACAGTMQSILEATVKRPDELRRVLIKSSGLAPWLRIFNTISQPSSGVENASEEIKDGKRIRVNGEILDLDEWILSSAAMSNRTCTHDFVE